MSDAVSTLEGRGLVQRQRDPADLRSNLVGLTDDGGRLATTVAGEVGPFLAAEAGTRTDRATTLRVLLGEIARLQDAGVITVDHSCLTCRHFRPRRADSPAHCLLLDQPLPDPALRVDCPEHDPKRT